MPEEDIALVQAREELKNQLAAGEYRTLVDALLTGIGRLIQKITRRSKPLPKWFSGVVLIIFVYVLGFGMLVIADDMPRMLRIPVPYGINSILMASLAGIMVIVSVLLINDYIHRVMTLWQVIVLDATESTTTLADFRRWLGHSCNPRLQLLAAAGGGLVLGAYILTATSAILGEFAGYGVALFTIVHGMFGATFFYLLLAVVELTVRLRRYDLKLFAANPSASEVIAQLSSLLSLGVYLVATYAALLTFIAAVGGFLPVYGPILVVVLWLPIIAIFVLNQTSLASIIRRVKWKTLNGIQAQVEALQAAGNDSSKETMDAINRLLDYHDRVKATRGSALDLRATLNFLNSLLLPLLGFLLANLDRVLAFFRPP